MKKIVQLITCMSLGIAAACFTGCTTINAPKGTITESAFGKLPDGRSIELYTLRNSHGMEATIMTYGGVVTSLKVPDKSGKFDDVVLGYDNLKQYLESSPFFGALIGRYANRIGLAKFSLDGVEYTLPANNPPNSLHGGENGFSKRVWTARPLPTATGPSLLLTYLSKNGEEGYPGNLEVKAVYSVIKMSVAPDGKSYTIAVPSTGHSRTYLTKGT